MDRFEVISETDGLLDGFSIKISCRCLVQWPAFLWDIYMDDFLSFDIVDGTEVERESVLQVINVGPIVHDGLLES